MTNKVKKEAEVANAEEQFGVKLRVNDKNEIMIVITAGFDKTIAQQMLNAIDSVSDNAFISREKRDGEGNTIVDITILSESKEVDLDKVNDICHEFMNLFHSMYLRMQLERVFGFSNELTNDTTKKLKGLLK